MSPQIPQTMAGTKRTAKPSPTPSSTACLVFTLFVGAAVNTSAFVTPTSSNNHPCSMVPQHSQFTKHRVIINMVSSTIPEDEQPWIMLEDILKKGKYDMMELQTVIDGIRHECQTNIQTLEVDIATIQQTLDEQHERVQREYCGDESSRSHSSPQQNSNAESIELIPTLKAVFAGYQATEDDRTRMTSAHPEDFSG